MVSVPTVAATGVVESPAAVAFRRPCAPLYRRVAVPSSVKIEAARAGLRIPRLLLLDLAMR